MKQPFPKSYPPILLLVVAVMSSCGALEDTAYVPDDVYFGDDNGYMLLADNGNERGDPSATERSGGSDSYYDPEEAKTVNQNYYDIAYRDPQYYNAGRFGWNHQVMMGMGMGMRPGFGVGMGFGRPGFGGYFNTGSFWGGNNSFYGYDPFWNRGFMGNPYFGGYNPNWMYGGFHPYGWNGMGGFGDPFFPNWYGPGYFGPGGSFYCPSFVFAGGWGNSNVYYGRRGSINGSSGSGSGAGLNTSRIVRNDNTGLMRRPSNTSNSRANSNTVSPQRSYPSSSGTIDRGSQRTNRPSRLGPPARNNSSRTSPSRPSRSSTTAPSRSSGRSSGGGQRRR